MTTTCDRHTPEERKDDNIEPMTYGSLPMKLYLCILKFLKVTDVVDMTPGDGNLAMACIISKIGYVGCCFTEAHANKLREHMVEQVSTCDFYISPSFREFGFGASHQKSLIPVLFPFDLAQPSTMYFYVWLRRSSPLMTPDP